MEDVSLFEEASRLKLRFNTTVGRLTVEDVWDLPLLPGGGNGVCLDVLAQTLSRELRDTDTESFVLEQKRPHRVLQLKFDLVRHIIKVRLAEQKAAEKAEKDRQRKEQILALIDEKQRESLKALSIDELRALVQEEGHGN